MGLPNFIYVYFKFSIYTQTPATITFLILELYSMLSGPKIFLSEAPEIYRNFYTAGKMQSSHSGDAKLSVPLKY
jgi:hypothetical protein